MHPIENIMHTAMSQIKEMVDVDTIVGAPIMTAGETMVVPVSKVSLGFLSGGGEYSKCSPVKQSGKSMDADNKDSKDSKGDDCKGRFPFAGAAAAGMCITPMAFISVNAGESKVLPVHYNCTIDRIVEVIPQMVEKIMKLAKQPKEKEEELTHEAPTID